MPGNPVSMLLYKIKSKNIQHFSKPEPSLLGPGTLPSVSREQLPCRLWTAWEQQAESTPSTSLYLIPPTVT